MEKALVKAQVSLFHGWGYVEGHWVYVPLWDPAPIEKKYRGFKQLQLASAIDDISKNVISKDHVAKLKEITLDLIGKSGRSSLVAYEEGDGICPDWWRWPFPKPRGGGDPDPGPVYFPGDLDKVLANQLAGHLLTTLANQVDMPQLKELGSEIRNFRG